LRSSAKRVFALTSRAFVFGSSLRRKDIAGCAHRAEGAAAVWMMRSGFDDGMTVATVAQMPGRLVAAIRTV